VSAGLEAASRMSWSRVEGVADIPQELGNIHPVLVNTRVVSYRTCQETLQECLTPHTGHVRPDGGHHGADGGQQEQDGQHHDG